MTYDKKKMFELALKQIKEKKLVFIAEVIAFTGMSKQGFYNMFPTGGDDHAAIMDAMTMNRVEIKASMRAKWYKSNSPALQVSLMKLMADEEELKKLSMNHTDLTTNGKEIQQAPTVVFVKSGQTGQDEPADSDK